MSEKKFQYKKNTPPDPTDGHMHECAFDENGHGLTTVAGAFPHQHRVYDFRVENFYFWDPEKGTEYISSHPGSLAFAEMEEIEEMEIFRAGTHNGDEFVEENLEEIAANFAKLKSEVRPKLKITHSEHQKSLAGLASYGDVADVYTKEVDGELRLFAKIKNVPKEVIAFIKEGRFPERSIEIYPEFKLGTKDGSPVYKNVLKAVALLGQEMPAVTGMAPVMLSEGLEKQKTVCFSDFCACKEEAEKHLASLLMETRLQYKEEEISKNKEGLKWNPKK